jgi:hypothetical protein
MCQRGVLQRSISLPFLLLQWVKQKEARIGTAAISIVDPLVLLQPPEAKASDGLGYVCFD